MEINGQLYPRGKIPASRIHWIVIWEGPRTSMDDVGKGKFLTLSGLELRPLGHPACSQSLYKIIIVIIVIIIIIIIIIIRPPLWSSGQSSWLQIQRIGFDSRLYQIFWEVMSLERGPLSLVNTKGATWKKK
jgi:hypothetical protein